MTIRIEVVQNFPGLRETIRIIGTDVPANWASQVQNCIRGVCIASRHEFRTSLGMKSGIPFGHMLHIDLRDNC